MKILDLCAGTGAWSEPYVEKGYDVVRITLPYFDVRTWEDYLGENYKGIMIAPPCRCFTRTNNGMPLSETEKIDAMSVVDACLRIVLMTQPEWWVLENPPGRLKRYLGSPRYTFQPWWFGGNTQKTTCLWGNFNCPNRIVYNRPGKIEIGGIQGRQGDYRRAVTPNEFAKAFCEANP